MAPGAVPGQSAGFIAQAGQAVGGWTIGFQSTLARGAEREIRQGGNHLLAALPQAGQVRSLAMLIDQLAKFIPSPTAKVFVKIFASVIPILAIPFTIYCGVVADRTSYPGFAAFFNRLIGDGTLSESIDDMSPWAVKVIDFTAKHLGDIIQVAVAVGAVALIALGSYVMGGFILGALAYQVLDERLELIPRKVSLFMETYMPLVSWVGVLIIGNPVLQVIAAITLFLYIPGVFDFVMEKMDLGIHKLAKKFDLQLPGATLKEIKAPLVEHKQPSHAELMAILDGDKGDFELNPAHCSKAVLDMSVLPQDRDFNKLLTMFNRINWTERYPQLRGKLRDDDRFLDFLSERFPTVARNTLTADFDHYVTQVATQEQKDKEHFAAEWVTTQLKDGLIKALNGERRIEGLQADLADAMENIARLIPFLEKLIPFLNEVDSKAVRTTFEDTLLALAVEGGFYCGRGVKRAASDLARQLLYPTLGEHYKPTGNPDKDYELQVLQALQDSRFNLVQQKYTEIAKKILRAPNRVKHDIHGLDIYRLFLSIGFTPLAEHEESSLTTSHYLIWEMYHHQNQFHGEMFRQYTAQLDDVLHAQGEAKFGYYIRRYINTNPYLSDPEKEVLIERYSNMAFSGDAQGELHRFRRLMLVGLGVLRPKAGSAAAKARAEADRAARALSTPPRAVWKLPPVPVRA